MIPFQIPGMILAGNMLLSKYGKSNASGKNKQVKRYTVSSKPASRYTIPRSKNTVNPLETLINSFRANARKVPPISESMNRLLKGVAETITRITKKAPKEDYEAVVKEFIPIGAGLVTPKYPSNSAAVQFADLDGDRQDELIASYRLNNDINTVILKKQNDEWKKINEINNQNYTGVNYRGMADIMGNGRKQLLISLPSKEQKSKLYGYSFENTKVVSLFNKEYNRFEVLSIPQSKGAEKAQLAIWTEKEGSAYDIQHYAWNGTELASASAPPSYYFSRVAPFYANRLKQAPYAPGDWYNLAEALIASNAYRDALMAVETGMNVDRNSEYTEKFTVLRDKILQ